MDDWTISSATDDQGIASTRLAKDFLHLLYLDVAADGYISRSRMHFGQQRDPGVDDLSNDPVDVYLYRAPPATAGLRIPEDFRGVVAWRYESTVASQFRFPPDFPAGQRVWWTDVAAVGETVLSSPPSLGSACGDALPIPVMSRDGHPVRTPDAGAEVEGIAAWEIGVTEPDGPWGKHCFVMFIGDHAGALAEARRMWREYGNGANGYVWNGWLLLIAPEAQLTNSQPYGVTRRHK